MKSLLALLTLVFSASFALALPEGGVECENDRTMDSYTNVKIKDGKAEFSFWESGFSPIEVTVAGTNVYAIVEEKVEMFGEGMEWVTIFSAFMVYNPADNTMTVTTAFSESAARTDVLKCK